MKSAWFHSSVGGSAITIRARSNGYVDRDVEQRFERALREAAAGSPDSVLAVSFLNCSHIDRAYLSTFSRICECETTELHVIAAPGTEVRRMFDLPELSFTLPIHDAFRDAFFSIAASPDTAKGSVEIHA